MFGVIKMGETWLWKQAVPLYFYIRNKGSTVRRREKEESYHEAEASHKKDLTFFSYGKQSLEVGCFYSGPFLFSAHTILYYPDEDFILLVRL
jgi:hypothetical protein